MPGEENKAIDPYSYRLGAEEGKKKASETIEATMKEIHDKVYAQGICDGAERLAKKLNSTHMTVDEAVEKVKEETKNG